MKNTIFVGVLVGGLFFTAVSNVHAVWWNPATWNSAASNQKETDISATLKNRDAEIEQLKAQIANQNGQKAQTESGAPEGNVVTKTIKVKDPNDQATIDALKSQLAILQNKYDMCISKASGSTQVNQSTDSQQVKIKAISAELANLTQVDFHIDNDPIQYDSTKPVSLEVGSSSLLDILNNTKKMDGTMLFPTTLGKWYVSYPSNFPSKESMHNTVKAYRNILQGELGSLGGINTTINISQ